MIDQASVFADRYKTNPQILQATVLGQGTDPSLDPYTALRALQLIKESNAMQMAQQAQGPTSAPSLASQAVAPQGLAAMMPMGAPAGQMPQGMPPQGQMPQQMGQAPQAPIMQASGGLAGLPTPEENYAEGGIVAFNGEGESLVRDPISFAANDDALARYSADPVGTELTGEGDAGMQARAFANYEASRKALEELTNATTTPDEDARATDKYLDLIRRRGGPDIYQPAIAKLDERETGRAKTSRQGQGLALLAAAGAILEGNTLARGAAKAFPVFAKEMGEVQRADTAEQRSIEQMRFALADAQRKERIGDIRGAQAAMEAARKARADANTFALNKAKGLADLDARAVQATRPRTGAGAGGPKLNELAFQANVDNLKETTQPKPGESPTAFDARIRAMAADLTTRQTKTSFSTSEIAPEKARVTTAPTLQKIDQQVTDALNTFKRSDLAGAAYRSAVRAKNMDEAARLLKEEEARLRKGFEASATAASGSGGNTRSRNTGTTPPPPDGFNRD
jgi:hypothetical protein